jgi:demethylmenaquinone methyltransferase/2-methoxy-6-polyprenyl-1,4-benzoquinol methylase
MVRAMTDGPRNAGDENTTHFGFRTVAENEKAGLVRGVFDAVAPRYDLMNDLMSGGLHRLWKTRLVDILAPRPGQAIVDVAGGTADVAMRILDRVTAKTDATPPVTVCDINAEMLSHGRDRAIDRGRLSGLTWVCGNAEALPFPDMSFDAYTIAFGLRNVTHIDKALAEARRVLKPGGRFLCLEFSRVAVPVLDRLYDTYSFRVLPWLGQTVAGNRDAYLYLAESIRRFPAQNALVGLMKDAGFARAGFRNLTGGVTAIHSGWRV